MQRERVLLVPRPRVSAVALLRNLGVAAHRLAFSSTGGARAYVAAWGVLRRAPWPRAVAIRIANAAHTAADGKQGVLGPPKGMVVETAAGPIKLLLRPDDFGFRPLIGRRLDHEDEVFRVLAAKIEEYDSVVEMGANVGVYTVAIASMFRSAGKDISRIVTFEPGDDLYSRLCANLELNGLGAVRTVHAAVSDHEGTSTFFQVNPMTSTGSLHRGFAQRFGTHIGESSVPTIDAATLQRFVEAEGHLLIKMDVEGHEPTILARMTEFVTSRRPDLIVEVLPSAATSISKIVSGWGYRHFHIHRDRLIEEPLSQADNVHRDWLLTPI